MWITAGALFRVRDGNVAHAFNHSAPRLPLRNTPMSQNRLSNLVADPHYRVQSRHRFLEDHGHARAPKLAQLLGGQSGQMHRAIAVLRTLLKGNIACDHSGGGEETHEGSEKTD